VTTPGIPPPTDAFVLGSEFGSDLDEATVKAITQAGSVGPVGSFTNLQSSINNPVGNVIPTGAPLWATFTREADSTFPRINLREVASSTGSAGGHSCSDSSHSHAGHTHPINYSVPDMEPAGHAANFTELGFISCSKDRTYYNMSFITGNSWTALGVNAFYLVVYKMSPTTGNLTLVSQTGDIKAAVTSINREYTVGLNTAIAAKKADIYAAGTLQVTSSVQTCNSLCALEFWPLTAPSGFKPAALYAYTPGSTTPLSTVSYASLTFANDFAPYYALS
jgi:hypothetical protein